MTEMVRWRIYYTENNINLNNQEWTPIGNHSNSFRGNFDGRNHTVTGMQISGELDRVGLFGECTKHNVNSAIKILRLKILLFVE